MNPQPSSTCSYLGYYGLLGAVLAGIIVLLFIRRKNNMRPKAPQSGRLEK